MAARPIEGVAFPLTEKGDRTTTETSKKIFASVFRGAGEEQLAQSVTNEKNWRYGYAKHIAKHVESSLKTPENAIKEAEAGLQYMHENFDFVRDGKSMKMSEAMKTIKGSFHTGFIKGTKQKPTNFEIAVPYMGRNLKGDQLKEQLRKWASYGTIENDAAEAIEMVVNNNKWADLSDKYFVLLGAGSAMGPYSFLLSLGANIIALDLDRAPIWQRLIGIAQNSCGTLTFPVKKPLSELKSSSGSDSATITCGNELVNAQELYANSGANLITQAPEINNWLQTVYPDKPLTVGCYVYLDGENHVKVVLACDAIMKEMSQNRKSSLAFLCTPTDMHVIPDAARRASTTNYNSVDWRNLLVFPIKTLMGHKYLTKNALRPIKSADGNEFSVVDGLTIPQGPNYALAKRMQHWRAIVARSKGCIVSSHIAPSTRTVSVVHNRQFAWAYSGMPYFKPFEIFDQDTSNAVMSAILIHDINNPKAAANPNTPLHNPLEMFKYNGFHGGVWRAGYKVGSVGEVSVLIHFLSYAKPLFVLIFVFLIYSILKRFMS